MKKTELLILFLALLVGAVLGLIFGQGSLPGLLLGVAMAALAYAFRSIYRLRSLINWLRQDVGAQPPESSGEWGGLFGELHDFRKSNLAQRQLLQQQITQLQGSFASLDEAVVLINEEEEIDWCNFSAERLLGLKAPKDYGQPVAKLLGDPNFLSYFDEDEYTKPLSLCSPVSESLALEMHITWFGEGNRMLFIRDITDVTKLEQTRTDFIGNVSHELRTPLTVISGYLETMSDSETEWQPALLQMSDQAQRMESLLADLMQLNKLECLPEKSQHDVLDIKPMINMIFDGISVLRDTQTLEVKQKTDAQLLGNREELYSAFSNLISNAGKYSPEDGKITVIWRLEASGASLSVTDTGIGIEAQHIERLTERFYRVDPGRDRATGGTGLGLAIVKHVLLRHQAALTIESTPGQGSTFFCHFPEHRIVRPAVSGE